MASTERSMGMAKHGKSGWKNGSGKSPKFRVNARREAEKEERKAPPPLPFSTVGDAFRQPRDKRGKHADDQ